MRQDDDAVEVRDSKARGEGPTLRFAKAGFVAWLDGAKNNQLDDLI